MLDFIGLRKYIFTFLFSFVGVIQLAMVLKLGTDDIPMLYFMSY